MKLTPEEKKQKWVSEAIVKILDNPRVELQCVKDAKEFLEKLAQKELEEEAEKL